MPIKDLPTDARPREKLLSRGPQALSDAELLAIVLRTGIKGKGVLQLAQELISPLPAEPPAASACLVQEPCAASRAGFGGISGLLRASSGDLRRVKGLGPAKRAELMAVLELSRRAMAEQLGERAVFDSPQTVKQYLMLNLSGKTHEVFAVLFLDSQHRLIAMEEMFQGTLTQTSVYPREVVKRALHHHAAALVLAHNHPSGNTQPSQADVQLTRTLASAVALVDVRVLDHLVIAPGQALSMAEEGLM
ncbi:DNA repair protein RadC [Diaphorobacter ruginosibacter]|uniref:RadC family protein n=1 Tax=Diaphorobacter ruginosibacter TaxID=1715720 RepID=UPI003341B213